MRKALRLYLLAIIALVIGGIWWFPIDGLSSRKSTLKQLDYAHGRRGGETAVDCFGIIEGKPQSLAEEKEIQSKLPAPLSASLLAEVFRSKYPSCDACGDEGGGKEGGENGGGKGGGGESGGGNEGGVGERGRGEGVKATCGGFCAAECEALLAAASFPLGVEAKDAEKEFPLAIAIFAFNEHPEQVYRLLRSLYHPANLYCIHVDEKTKDEIFAFYRSLVKCLPNVFLADRRVNGVYASWTRLEAEFACMRTLLKQPTQWKYYMNYAGSEMPLRTNEEMVRILRRYDGQNDIEGIVRKNLENRWKVSWKMEGKNMKKTSEKKSSPPHNMTIIKGSAYAAFTRGFVQFALNDQRAKDLFEWSKDTYSPDEFFWSTLQYNPQLKAPGASKNGVENRTWRMKFSNWLTSSEPPCHGIKRHGMCIFGLKDLPNVVHLQWFTLNKLDLSASRTAFECIEEWHLNRTRSRESSPLDMAAYPLAML